MYASSQPHRGFRALVAAATFVALSFPLIPAGHAAEGTSGGLIQINAATDQVARSVTIAPHPTAVAVAGGRVWVTAQGDKGVWMVNPTTGATWRIPDVTGSAPLSLAADRNHAYVMGEGSIKVVQPWVRPVVTSVKLATVDGSPILVASGPAGVWGIAGDTVFRLRLVHGHPTLPMNSRILIPRHNNVEQDGRLTAMAVGRHSLWVIGDVGDRRLWRIDPAGPRITATIDLPFTPVDVAVGLGGVWVTGQISDRLYEIDPGSGRIMRTIAVGREPMGVAVGAGAVWVTNAIDGTVSKIDPVTGTVVATIQVAGSPSHVAVGGGSVWATSTPFLPKPTGNAIRIGVIADCGAFSFVRQAMLAGAELPLIQRGATLAGPDPSDGLVGATIGGRPVQFLSACSIYGDRSAAISALSTLVERDGADIVIGSEIEGEGNAVREYARLHPGVTFLVTSSDQSTTLRRTVPNLFRFEADAGMWDAGLGAYARNTLHWKTAGTVSSADFSGWGTVTGFDAEFCSLGGHVPHRDRIWVDTAHNEVVGHRLPTGVDGTFLPGGVGGTGTFLTKWAKAHPPLARHLLVGWAVLAPVPALLGVVGASPDPFEPTPAWDRYTTAFANAFPNVSDPWLYNLAYYDAMEPVVEVLGQAHGDFSDGQRRFAEALAQIRYHSPEGLITLDQRHQAIAPIYLGRVERQPDRTIIIKQIRVIRHVEQTFNGYFSPTTPPPSKTAPPCINGNPPPWAR